MNRCICGCPIHLEDSFVLDCKHDLCQDCSRVPSISTQCPACRIQRALESVPLDSAALVRHIEDVYKKHKELVMEKQQALRGERKLFDALKRVASARCDAGSVFEGLQLSQRSQEGVFKPENSTPVAKDLFGSFVQDASSPWKRRRTESGGFGGSEPSANDLVAYIQLSHERRQQDLSASLDQMKEAHAQTYSQLQSLCSEREDKIRALEERCRAAEGEASFHKSNIDSLGASSAKHSQELDSARETIAQLKRQLEEEQQKVSKAETRAAQFERWARQSRAHYKERVKELEIALGNRAGGAVGDPSPTNSQYPRSSSDKTPPTRSEDRGVTGPVVDNSSQRKGNSQDHTQPLPPVVSRKRQLLSD